MRWHATTAMMLRLAPYRLYCLHFCVNFRLPVWSNYFTYQYQGLAVVECAITVQQRAAVMQLRGCVRFEHGKQIFCWSVLCLTKETSKIVCWVPRSGSMNCAPTHPTSPDWCDKSSLVGQIEKCANQVRIENRAKT